LPGRALAPIAVCFLGLGFGMTSAADNTNTAPVSAPSASPPHLTDAEDRMMSGELRSEAEAKSRANALYAQALISLTARDSDSSKVLEQLREVVKLDPKFNDAQAKIADVLLQTGQIESAFEQLQAAVKSNPDSASLKSMLGYTQHLRGQNDDAERLCTQALVRDPTEAASMKVLLEIAGDRDDLSGAVVHIKDILRNGTKVPASAWLTLARLYVEVARSESHTLSGDVVLKTLLPIYQEAAAKPPPDVERLTLLAEAYQDLGRKREALKTLKEAGELEPASVEIILHCAGLELDLGENEAALKDYRTAYDLNPNMSGLREKLGRIYLDNAKFTEAAELLQDALVQQPNDPGLEADLGVAYEGAHQHAKAQDWFQRAFASPACPPEAYLKLAVIELGSQQVKEAGKTLAAAQVRFPQSAKILFYQAIQNRYAKKYKAALACLTAMRTMASVSETDVFSPYYYRETALTMNLAGQSERIEPLLREGLGKYPENPDLMNGLAYTWAEHGTHLPEALALSRHAAQLDPGNGAVQDTWGWVYFKMGKVKDALPYLQRAAVMTNNDSVVLQHVGDALWKLGRSREAVAAWRRALQKDPGNHDLTTRINAAPAPANHADLRSAPTP